MSDWNIRRKDRIEELTHDLHAAAAAEVRAELNADYREEFGEDYASKHPYHIAPETFERLVLERMRKNAAKPKPRQNQAPAGIFKHFATPEAEAEHLAQVKAAQERGDVPF